MKRVTKEQPVGSPYRCYRCGKVVLRESTKQWIKSYCEKSGVFSRLMKVAAAPAVRGER